MPVLSIVTGREAPPVAPGIDEVHVPLRPAFAPLDGTRYDHWSIPIEIFTTRLSVRRLRAVYQENEVVAVHAVAHSPSVWPAYLAAQSLGIPFLLSVHDDLRYLLRSAPLRDVALERLSRVWRGAHHRFVISAVLGDEYAARYGGADYDVVTDGLTDDDFRRGPARSDAQRLQVYFAGLFHRGYRPNLQAFMGALDILAERRPALDVAMTCRCGSLPDQPSARTPLSVLPFDSEAKVRADVASADLLYLPLMLEDEYRDMVAFSLSTKLVTYLASGVPIVYHGPGASAAHDLLAEHDAAILVTSNDPVAIAETLLAGIDRAPTLVANARGLARQDFMLADQRERFWSAVTDLSKPATTLASGDVGHEGSDLTDLACSIE